MIVVNQLQVQFLLINGVIDLQSACKLLLYVISWCVVVLKKNIMEPLSFHDAVFR